MTRKSNSHCLQTWWAENHLNMHNTSNLEVDQLQQQKISLSFTPVSQEPESEVTNLSIWLFLEVNKETSKLRILKTLTALWPLALETPSKDIVSLMKTLYILSTVTCSIRYKNMIKYVFYLEKIFNNQKPPCSHRYSKIDCFLKNSKGFQNSWVNVFISATIFFILNKGTQPTHAQHMHEHL